MNTKNYLTFHLHDIKYGIDANLVKEIFLLPELIPIAEAPIDVLGILNFRGEIIPVMHLDLRLGNPIKECEITDSVIVLEWEEILIGVIVDRVREVETIDSVLIKKEVDYGRVRTNNPAFITGIAKVNEEALALLNPQALVREPDAVQALVEENHKEVNKNGTNFDLNAPIDSQKTLRIISNFYDSYCPKATIEERAIFRRRADNLRQVNTEAISDITGQIPVAVLGLGGEYFAIALNTVREFINIRDFTPIPCCPSHVVGNINLRGEIITLIDIRGILNLSTPSIETGAKAVVVGVDDIVAGLPVDEVLDVMYLSSSELNSVPVAVNANSHEYLQGTASYSEKMMSVIDLSKILTDGKLVVNEEG
jgi:purine-binding chemotaxis protein CheW